MVVFSSEGRMGASTKSSIKRRTVGLVGDVGR